MTKRIWSVPDAPRNETIRERERERYMYVHEDVLVQLISLLIVHYLLSYSKVILLLE